MGKYLSVVVGAVTTIVGLLLLVKWWGDLLLVLKGSVPAMLIFAGVIALIAGISEMKDEAGLSEKNQSK